MCGRLSTTHKSSVFPRLSLLLPWTASKTRAENRWEHVEERLLLGETALTGLAPISLRKLPAERRGSGPANGACVPLASAPCLLLASASRIHLMGYRLEGVIHRGSAITHTDTQTRPEEHMDTFKCSQSDYEKGWLQTAAFLLGYKVLTIFMFKIWLKPLRQESAQGPWTLLAPKAPDFGYLHIIL